MQIKKAVYILRSPPGGGKNYYIDRFITIYRKLYGIVHGEYAQFHICSADDYFIRPDGIYDWNGKLLKNAHNYCFNNFIKALKNRCPIIFINNTNIKKRDYQRYIDVIKNFDYEIREKIIGNLEDDFVKLCADRNVHKVPYETIKKMIESFEK